MRTVIPLSIIILLLALSVDFATSSSPRHLFFIFFAATLVAVIVGTFVDKWVTGV